MEMIINKNYIIDEVEFVQQKIEELVDGNCSLEISKEFINSHPYTIYHFDQQLTEKTENDKDSQIAWLDSGYCYKNEPIFISLLRYENEYCGHFVGTARFLAKGLANRNGNSSFYRGRYEKFMNKYYSKIHNRTKLNLNEELSSNKKENFENTTQLEVCLREVGFEIKKDETGSCEDISITMEIPKELTDVTEEIFYHLLYPNWKSINGLDRYIKICGCRIKQLIEKEKTEYYVKNKYRSVIINTGLLSPFGTDYLVLYRYNERYKNYIAHMVVSGKNDYIENGFSKEDANVILKPIQFVDSPMYFDATIDDFDINQKCLIHIVDERRNRFSDDIREASSNFIYMKIMESLERGLKIQMRDHTYAKLSYSGKDGKLSWLLPLHITHDFTKEPELVLVIRKNREYYEVKTILPYDDELQDRITALALYSKLW